MPIKAYQWRPWMKSQDAPEVRYDMHGAYVMDRSTRLPLNPLCWIVVQDDGHIDVKPPSWKPDP